MTTSIKAKITKSDRQTYTDKESDCTSDIIFLNSKQNLTKIRLYIITLDIQDILWRRTNGNLKG